MVFLLLSAAAIAAIGIMSPGPDFLAVTHAAMTANRKNAFAVVLGVVIGNVIWASAALFGIGVLFTLFPTFFILFKILGGLYLIWLGVQMFRGSRRPLVAVAASAQASTMASMIKGLTTTTANPKPAIYYTSALVAIAPPDSSFDSESFRCLSSH